MTKRRLMRHLRRALTGYVPRIASRTGLPAQGFTLEWSTDTPVAATYADQGRILLNWEWFSWHEDDYGALVHEYTHLIQNVPGGTCPGDVIEGFADAMRYLFGLYDPSWWSPSPMAKQIAGLSYTAFQRLAQRMQAGTYEASLLVEGV